MQPVSVPGRVGRAIGAAGVALLLGAVPAWADDVVSGPARSIDADIILVGKQRVILYGVDAPERSQLCFIGDLKWGCWEAAKNALDALLANGDASCTLTADKPDPFGRRYGTCTSNGKDVGAELVREGMARAFVQQAKTYLPQEDEAKAAKLGIWQDGARVDAPWDWRKQNPTGFR